MLLGDMAFIMIVIHWLANTGPKIAVEYQVVRMGLPRADGCTLIRVRELYSNNEYDVLVDEIKMRNAAWSLGSYINLPK